MRSRAQDHGQLQRASVPGRRHFANSGDAPQGMPKMFMCTHPCACFKDWMWPSRMRGMPFGSLLSGLLPGINPTVQVTLGGCVFFSLAKQCMHAPASYRLCILQRQRGQTERANARLASGQGYKLNTNPVLQASVTSCEPQVVWAEGATQTGSSGAPLIDAASGRAVGALTGGFATCASAGGADFFGRLASEVRAPAPAARRIHCGSCGGLSLCPTRAQAAWRSCMGGEDRWHARAHAPACIKTLPDVAAM